MNENKKMFRTSTLDPTLDSMFDEVTNHINNDLVSSPTTTMETTTNYVERTKENKGEEISPTTNKSTEMEHGVETPITTKTENLSRAEGDHPVVPATSDGSKSNEADKALDSMLVDISKLTAESFYDEKEDNRRSGSFSNRRSGSFSNQQRSGSFGARKQLSQKKQPTLSKEQKRLSVANIVDGEVCWTIRYTDD